MTERSCVGGRARHVMRHHITLRHLHVFLAIVRHGGLSNAAEALHVTQSAVSKSLKELESQLDRRLMDRGRSGVRLTRAGADFHRFATQTLVNFNKAVDSVGATQRHREIVRIGALPTAAGSIVPAAIARMRGDDAGIDVRIESAGFEVLVEKLRRGEIDLIVGRMISRDTVGLSFEALYEEPILAVVRRAHAILSGGPVDLATLRDRTVIVPMRGTIVRQAVDDLFYAAGIEPPPSEIESVSDAFSRAFAIDHDAIWFAPRGSVDLDLRHGLLVDIGIRSSLLIAPIGLTRSAGTDMTRATQAFTSALRAVAQT